MIVICLAVAKMLRNFCIYNPAWLAINFLLAHTLAFFELNIPA